MIKFLKNILPIFALFITLAVTVAAQNDYKRAALWEKEINAFAAADKKDFPKKGKVLFVGSFSIRAWRALGARSKKIFPNFTQSIAASAARISKT